MINAYILIMMSSGNSEIAIKEMRKLPHVEKISVVAGEYDIVVRVSVNELEELLSVTDQLQQVKGVKKTTTQVIEKEIAL